MADEPTRIAFNSPELAATFRASQEKRTISGLAVPWGKVARSGFSRWRFEPGSLHWADEGRTKLNLNHDPDKLIGRAVRLQSVRDGLDVTFKVARGEEGDRALSLAEDGVLDGFSIEVDFDDDAGDEFVPDPSDKSVNLVKRATLRGVALTGMPAFDDARATAVVAMRNRKGNEVSEEDTREERDDRPADKYEIARAFELMVEKFEMMQAEQAKQSQQLIEMGAQKMSAAFVSMLENMDDPQGVGREPVKAARFAGSAEKPIYTFDGYGPSLVRDAWHAKYGRDEEAEERLRQFRQQSETMAKLGRPLSIHFATNTTTTAADVIPPGYRPDLYQGQLMQGRPFVNLVSRGQIGNATPFVVPRFVSATGATGDHVEGTNPSSGDLTFEPVTVQPQAVSGILDLTREIVDASNPAIDQIALAAMRESYDQQTETKVYDHLNGTDGQGGTITSGFVPSGAQVATTTGGSAGAGTFGGLELLRGIRGALALYPFRRFGSPNGALLSQEATSALATAEDANDRPLLPSVGAQNTMGIGNAVSAGWFVDGLPFVPAWSISDNATGDADVFMFNRADVWVWESPTLMFRFEEKSGPAIIQLALFGYFATHLLRPVGLSAIRHTVGA